MYLVALVYPVFAPMTLTRETGQDILKVYPQSHIPKLKFLDQGFQKLDQEQQNHTDKSDRTDYHIRIRGGNNNEALHST